MFQRAPMGPALYQFHCTGAIRWRGPGSRYKIIAVMPGIALRGPFWSATLGFDNIGKPCFFISGFEIPIPAARHLNLYHVSLIACHRIHMLSARISRLTVEGKRNARKPLARTSDVVGLLRLRIVDGLHLAVGPNAIGKRVACDMKFGVAVLLTKR